MKLKKENESLEKGERPETSVQTKELASMTGTADDAKKVKELEKRVTKLRNENQQLSTQLEKATRLLEREIGEVVDVDSLYKDESSWKGRA